MSGYALTPLAKTDIFDIWSYIAEHNEDAASRVEQAIYDACGFLADGSLRGHSRPDLTTRPMRFWTLTRYPNYIVVYRPDTTPLQIIAVLHGRRNIERFLNNVVDATFNSLRVEYQNNCSFYKPKIRSYLRKIGSPVS